MSLLDTLQSDLNSWPIVAPSSTLQDDMTIIAALRCEDGLILAADGRVTDRATGYPERERKLDYVPSPPLAWGFSGDGGVGAEFGRWMRSDGLQAARDWHTLRDHAVTMLARLNGRKRELLQVARKAEDAEDTASVLMAGYVGGTLEVLELDERAGHAFYGSSSSPFMAIGSGALHARIVHGITSELNPIRSAESRMRFVMSRAIPIAQLCGFPARLLHITADGVAELSALVQADGA